MLPEESGFYQSSIRVFLSEPPLVWFVTASYYPGRGVSTLPLHFPDSCCFLAPSESFLRSLYLADRNSSVVCNKCQTDTQKNSVSWVIFLTEDEGTWAAAGAEWGVQSKEAQEQHHARFCSSAPGSSFVNSAFFLLWKTLFRSIQKNKSGIGTLKNTMCAMTRDLLNIVYILCVDILRIIFYAALPFTVLAEETAKSVWNNWSHLLPGTVNNDLLCNTNSGANHCICINTHRGSPSTRKKTVILIPVLGGSGVALLIEIMVLNDSKQLESWGHLKAEDKPLGLIYSCKWYVIYPRENIF